MQCKKYLLSLLVVGLVSAAHSAQAYDNGFGEENRTVNRAVTGDVIHPQWLMALPEHYEFLPATSNNDPQHRHPAQWAGQDWDPSMWGANWTPETTVQRFFQGRVFHRQYTRNGKMPVLEVGPTFWKLSDLDRRRSLKLLADYSDVFGKGFQMIELRDWYTRKIVGSYTEKGMLLN